MTGKMGSCYLKDCIYFQSVAKTLQNNVVIHIYFTKVNLQQLENVSITVLIFMHVKFTIVPV